MRYRIDANTKDSGRYVLVKVDKKHHKKSKEMLIKLISAQNGRKYVRMQMTNLKSSLRKERKRTK